MGLRKKLVSLPPELSQGFAELRVEPRALHVQAEQGFYH